MNSALIVVDVQDDFIEGGRLAVAGGKEVATRIGNYLEHLGGLYRTVVATKDWHEEWPRTNGGHFSSTPDYVNSWPVHCEAHLLGSDINTEVSSALTVLEVKNPVAFNYETNVFYKGLGRPDYSGFQGHNNKMTALHTFLRTSGIRNVDVVGIAGDYCVLQTALDAKKLGYTVNILSGMVASVGGPEATKHAIDTVNST